VLSGSNLTSQGSATDVAHPTWRLVHLHTTLNASWVAACHKSVRIGCPLPDSTPWVIRLPTCQNEIRTTKLTRPRLLPNTPLDQPANGIAKARPSQPAIATDRTQREFNGRCG